MEDIYRVVVSHSFKYLNSEVAGFLVEKDGKQRVLPFTHNPINTCIFLMAVEMIEKKGYKIQGFYDFNEFQREEGNFGFQKKILKFLYEKYQQKMIYLHFFTVNDRENSDRNAMSYQEALKDHLNDNYRIKVQKYTFIKNLNLEEDFFLDQKVDNKNIEEDFNSENHLKLNDFEDFLDNPEIEFF